MHKRRDMPGYFEVLVCLGWAVCALVIGVVLTVKNGGAVLLLAVWAVYLAIVFWLYWRPMLLTCTDRITIGADGITALRGRRRLVELSWSAVREVGLCLWQTPALMKGGGRRCCLYICADALDMTERLCFGTCLRHQIRRQVIYLNCGGMDFTNDVTALAVDRQLLHCLPEPWRTQLEMKHYPTDCACVFTSGDGAQRVSTVTADAVCPKVRRRHRGYLWLSYFSLIVNAVALAGVVCLTVGA